MYYYNWTDTVCAESSVPSLRAVTTIREWDGSWITLQNMMIGIINVVKYALSTIYIEVPL